MAKDYYHILQVTKDAGAEEIKKAYRRLALRFHPDVNKDEPASVEYFRDITEAYGVLIDADKRRKYDRDRARGFAREDIYQDIFARSEFRDVFEGLPLRKEWIEKLFEVSRVIAYESIVYGGRPGEVLKRSLARLIAGRATSFFHSVMDIHEDIRIPGEIALRGGHITIEYRPGFSKRRIRVSVPQNIRQGTILRIEGMGRKNLANKSGDLYLHVDISPL